MKKYIFLYQYQTDGEAVFKLATAAEIKQTIKTWNLSRYDYAIFDGKILKTFDNQIDLNKL